MKNGSFIRFITLKYLFFSRDFLLNAEVEVGFEFLLSGTIFVLQVAQNDAILQQGNAAADIYRVVEVVAGDDYGGMMLFVVALEQVLDDALATWVEEVEGLVEDEQFRIVEHGGDNANLLLVAHREVADVLLLSQYFAVHEAIKSSQTQIHLFLL